MNPPPFASIDHAQLAMPPGREAEARTFYAGVLGMEERRKPRELAGRGGVWFESGAVQLHLGVETPFTPARKAHPALRCTYYARLVAALVAAGATVRSAAELLDGTAHAYIDDPFGNRLELIDTFQEAGS